MKHFYGAESMKAWLEQRTVEKAQTYTCPANRCHSIRPIERCPHLGTGASGPEYRAAAAVLEGLFKSATVSSAPRIQAPATPRFKAGELAELFWQGVEEARQRRAREGNGLHIFSMAPPRRRF